MRKLKLQYLDTFCKKPTHWKGPWCWERLKAGRKGDDRGWDGWMASPTQWTWVWANSRRWWRTGKPGVLQSMGSQRVQHHWGTEEQQQHRKAPWRSNRQGASPHSNDVNLFLGIFTRNHLECTEEGTLILIYTKYRLRTRQTKQDDWPEETWKKFPIKMIQSDSP